MRIEIAGGIASGKSTLTEALALHDVVSIFENFAKNPFFGSFYRNPSRYAFETEITFMLQHYSSIADAVGSNKELVACDFSTALDLAYARLTLSCEDQVVFEAVFDRVLSKLKPPDLIVVLQCAPDTELHRIRERARTVEQAITLNYLAKLNKSLDRVLLDRRFSGLKTLRIDSGKMDFRPAGKEKDAVISRVLAAVNL